MVVYPFYFFGNDAVEKKIKIKKKIQNNGRFFFVCVFFLYIIIQNIQKIKYLIHVYVFGYVYKYIE